MAKKTRKETINGNVHSDQFLSCEDKKSKKAVINCVIFVIY